MAKHRRIRIGIKNALEISNYQHIGNATAILDFTANGVYLPEQFSELRRIVPPVAEIVVPESASPTERPREVARQERNVVRTRLRMEIVADGLVQRRARIGLQNGQLAAPTVSLK